MRYLILALLLIACAPAKEVTAVDRCQESKFDLSEIVANTPVLDFSSDNYARTGNSAEHYNCILAPDKIDLDLAQTIFSIKLENVKAGDVISFDAWAEATNLTPKPMMVAWFFVLADSPTNTVGQEITERRGYNISANMHHGVFGGSGNWKFKRDSGVLYINLVLYAASGERRLTGESLRIERDYGEMSVVVN